MYIFFIGVTQSLSSAIAPTPGTKQRSQSELGISHVADICSVHWNSKLAILKLLWKFITCDRASALDSLLELRASEHPYDAFLQLRASERRKMVW